MSGFSVIIVAYNSGDFLPACLHSIFHSQTSYKLEVIVLDNGSPEPISKEVRCAYPQVKWLDSPVNLGFGAGCNFAYKQVTMPYVFVVNPDTMISPHTFEKMMQRYSTLENPGALGCKILNNDGSLQWACRRSFPSPLAAIYKTVGLANLFPQSKRFATYNMSYLDPETETKVDAVSGSFFLVSKSIWEQVQGFDEDYFLYGEDLDIFYRIQKAGYNNYYYPQTSIIHFKGQSFKTRRFKSYIDFYNAMLIFATKHRDRFKPFPHFTIATGVLLAALLGVFSRLVPQWWKLSTDFFFIVCSILLLHPSVAQISASSILVSTLPFLQVLPFFVQGDYVQNGFRSSGAFRYQFYWALVLGSLSIALTGTLHTMPVFIVSLFCFHLWRKTAYWLEYFVAVFSGKVKRAIILGAHKIADALFAYDNVIPHMELLGVIPFPNIPPSPQSIPHILASEYQELPTIQKRTGLQALLVVPDENGTYGELPDAQTIQQLSLKVNILIGNATKGEFTMADMSLLD
jgi:GT2 family glycosyltransferase